MWLANHHPAHRRYERQAMDVIVIEGIDATGMSFAADLVNLSHHLQHILKPAVLEDGEDDTQFLAGKKIFFADMVFFDDDKFPIRGNFKACAC